MSELKAVLPQDFIALTCPLTAETEKLIDADALGRVKPSAYLLNAARGRVVDEPALVDALARRQIRGAAHDVMVEEPLPAASPRRDRGGDLVDRSAAAQSDGAARSSGPRLSRL